MQYAIIIIINIFQKSVNIVNKKYHQISCCCYCDIARIFSLSLSDCAEIIFEEILFPPPPPPTSTVIIING